MKADAAGGRLALQRCTACGNIQYPSRELCGVCLADALEWRVTDDEPAEVLASMVLHHSHDPAFNGKLPIHVGLIRFDAGPTAVCFLTEACSAGTRVRVTAQLDGMGRAVLSAAAAISKEVS
jgi:uncharacterized OB-fold protein